MGADKFVLAGVLLDYCEGAVIPQTPHVQDVLYAMRMAQEDTYFLFATANASGYIENVALVVAACGQEVLTMRPFDEQQARRIIAQTILELCDERASCWFNMAFKEAVEQTGAEVPPVGTPRNELAQGCSCSRCEKTVVEEGLELPEGAELPGWMRANQLPESEHLKHMLLGGHAVA